jgi:hypothetical protein
MSDVMISLTLCTSYKLRDSLFSFFKKLSGGMGQHVYHFHDFPSQQTRIARFHAHAREPSRVRTTLLQLTFGSL